MDINIDLDDTVKKEDKKPEKTKTYDLLILDKSSSMESVKDATIAGFNEKIASLKSIQKEFPDQEYIACLVAFNQDHEILVWNKNVNEVAELTKEYYKPSGMTALYDAIGHSVNKLLKDIKEDIKNKQTQIIVTIFTDGEENSSQKFYGKKIYSLIEELESGKQWKFNYIGSNHDVKKVAKDLGISVANTMSYTSNAQDIITTMGTVNKAYHKYAATKSIDKDALTANTFSLDNSDKNNIPPVPPTWQQILNPEDLEKYNVEKKKKDKK